MSKKGDETKEKILEAAKALFAQKGFKDVSMSDICNETGLSRGGLYRHYSSVSEIFREIISDDFSFDIRIENKESALTILTSTLKYIEDEIVHSENSLSLAIYEYANVENNREEFLAIEDRAKKRWIKLIEYGVKTGEFCKVNPTAVAEMILYYYQGLRMWSRVVDIDEHYASNYRMNILHSLIKERK